MSLDPLPTASLPPVPPPDVLARDDTTASDDDSAPEPPPRGVHRMAAVRWVILGLSVLLAIGSWYSFATAASSGTAAVLYQCPMHPEIVADHPGDCPICHMTLERVSAERIEAPTSSSAPAGPAGSAAPPAPAGVSPVVLALDRVQAIGVRTAKAEERPTGGALRAPAIVEAPEQNVAEVHVRAAGYVEAIAVGQTGVKVKPGQLLLSIYSPEIYQAQSELLATQNWTGLGGEQAARDRGARRKLELLGVSGRVADRVIAEQKPLRSTAVSAPIGGYVTKKNVLLGSFVTPEMALYEIVDLSQVYLVADLFQSGIGAVTVGTKGTFRSRTRSFSTTAVVDLVYPQVNVEARTTRVRMTLENVDLSLFPGEYGMVEFDAVAGRSVVVPTDALIDTGNEQYVFVVTAPGRFEPRRVDVAGETDGGFELRSGVSAGDSVVSGAAFLIDSESRLRASISSSVAAEVTPTSAGSGAPPAAATHRH